jgi:hypothetical protein
MSPIERTVFMKGAQIGGTECGNNWMGYIIHQAPGPMMAVQPTVEMAKRNSKQRIDPLIEESEVLRKLVRDPRSRDSGNTVLSKDFPGGVLVMTGANSAVGLRSMAARYLFLDEVDAYPGDVEGSPVGWFSWGDAAKQFEQAQKNPALLQVFVNTVLGETWTLLSANISAITRGWSRDCRILLKELRKDRVPRRLKRFNTDAVTSWWQQYRGAAGCLKRSPDEYLSNWLPIEQMPANRYLHALSETRADRPILEREFPYPGGWHDERFVTFVSADQCRGRLGSTITIASSDCIHTSTDIKKANTPLSA